MLQCVLSDMAAEPISLSYLWCQLLPPEKVTEGIADSKHITGTTDTMPTLFHLFTPTSSPSHTHLKHPPPSVYCKCDTSTVSHVLLLHFYTTATPLFTVFLSHSLIFKGAINTAYVPPHRHTLTPPIGSTHGNPPPSLPP